MGEKLTKSDVNKIKEEIENRKLVIRKKAIADVQEARSHGDLSENFEYHAAKQFKNQNESRIRYLEKVLKYAEVVDDSSNSDEVGLYKTVTVHFIEDDEDATYRIVTSIRGNTTKGLISIESPIGKALMGHKEGEEVTVKVNDSYSYKLRIVKIENTEEDDSIEIKKY